MSIEIITLKLPSKSEDESKKDYMRRLKDGRSASKIVEDAAFRGFGIVSKPKKGEDGYDDESGDKVEHKMVTTATYIRRSQFTGDNRICLPDDVVACCEKDYVLSYILGPIPFSIRVTKDTIQEWLKLGHIDPVTGCLRKDSLFFLARPFDGSRAMPVAGSNEKNCSTLATERIKPKNIARRVKKAVDTYEKKCQSRIVSGRKQQERYARLSNSN
jgi:hypothetical protein